MADWLEKERERNYRENAAAIHKEFDRALADKQFPDTKDSWYAFVYGWQGVHKFEVAKRKQANVGQGSMLLTCLCWVIGGMGLASVAMLYAFNYENLVIDRAVRIVAFSLVLFGIGFLSIKRSERLSREALSAFHAKWGNPDEEREKGVDE